MTVTTTTVMSNSIQAQLLQAEYIMAVRRTLGYAQSPIAWSPPQAVIGMGNRATSLAIPMYFEIAPSTAAISQTADVVPVVSADAVVTISPIMIGQTMQLSQVLELTATPDVLRPHVEMVARAAAESIDYLARSAAIGGALSIFGGDAATRATVSPGSTSDEIDTADFLTAVNALSGGRTPKLPGPGAGYAAILRKATSLDLVEDGVLILVAEYSRPEMILNGEIGMHLAGVRLIESDWAKIYHGAGSSGGTTGMGSSATVSTALAIGSTALIINTSMSASNAEGRYYMVGAEESTALGESIATETVYGSSGAATTSLSIIGGGVNGGFLYPHSSGESVMQNYQVYATVFVGAESLLKCYTNDDGIGPDGVIYPPEVTGSLRQFKTLGYKWFGGFGRVAENRLFRVEHACSRWTIGR